VRNGLEDLLTEPLPACILLHASGDRMDRNGDV